MLDLVFLKNTTATANLTRGHTFPPTRGHAVAGASPSPTLLPRNKRANNVRFGFEIHKQSQQTSQTAIGLTLEKRMTNG